MHKNAMESCLIMLPITCWAPLHPALFQPLYEPIKSSQQLYEVGPVIKIIFHTSSLGVVPGWDAEEPS